MRIQAGQVGQVVLSTLQGAKELDGKLELKVGSVVRATLMQHTGKDEVLLQIEGKTLRARLDASVKPGDQVDLLVTGEQKQGAMELKVVGQPIRGGEGGKQLDISGLVRMLNLPDTEESKALVQEFVNRGVPLKPDTVRAALAVLRSLPQVTPSHIATLGKMAELGIPILPSSFEAMHTLENGPKLHELLTKIQSTLLALLPEADSLAGKGAGTTTQVGASIRTASQWGGQTPAGPVQIGGETAGPGAASGQTASPTATAMTGQPESVMLKTATAQTGSTAVSNSTDGQQTATSAKIPVGNSMSAGTGAPTVPSNTDVRTGGATSLQTGANQSATQTGTTATSALQTQIGTLLSTGITNTTTSAVAQLPNQTSGAVPQAERVMTQTALQNGEVVNHFPENSRAVSIAHPGSHALSASTRANLEQLLHVTDQLLNSPDDAAPTAAHLADKAKQLGLNFEEQLAHALRRLPADSDPAQIKNAFQQALKMASEQGTSLKHALLLSQATSAELDAAGLGFLLQDVSTLLKHVTGQQMMQMAGSDRTDLLYQFAAVPIRHGKDEQTVELHVMARKGPGQKAIDAANCYVLFRLDMPNLGELDIHLHIVDKVVGVRFLSENYASLTLTPSDQRDLRNAMQKVGFHLGVCKVEDKKQREPGEHQPLLPPILTHKQFDLKI
ncbi:hypothetical protein CIG75_12205 [Tumebacillus algifaecis]|uniref:Flagellar hook-length control protein-like C-terminal domain-containing protein n=1 Tax=Tumebacillus algifaecis TaxID=1214604 RepID=A0A223D2Q2_9BACL|nr:flagellar hook-length control protein FliK [Tumebacillus algifaecis]ASS75677.1 hypothetical protein CIG75_12205 [Tumebacillus algifaecis]